MSESIFKSIFGANWENLPAVMKAHYANRAYTDDEVIVEGTLDVMAKAPLKWFALPMKWLGQIPIKNEKNVPVTVWFASGLDTKAFHFRREFRFKNQNPYIFHSRMVQIKDNKVIEIMPFGLSWKMLYRWDGTKVILDHDGYALNLFGYFIPLPLTFLLGKGYAEEHPIDCNTFSMITHITHPLWGKIYEYKGTFKVMERIW